MNLCNKGERKVTPVESKKMHLLLKNNSKTKFNQQILVCRNLSYFLRHYSGFVLFCLCRLTPLSTIFRIYRGSQFYWWRKPKYPEKNYRPSVSHWHILSHNVVSSTPQHERRSNLQLHWWYALISQVVVNLTTIRSRPRWPLPHSVWNWRPNEDCTDLYHIGIETNKNGYVRKWM